MPPNMDEGEAKRHSALSLKAWVAPTSAWGMLWWIAQRVAGGSQPGNRHVKSRQRTKSASACKRASTAWASLLISRPKTSARPVPPSQM